MEQAGGCVDRDDEDGISVHANSCRPRVIPTWHDACATHGFVRQDRPDYLNLTRPKIAVADRVNRVLRQQPLEDAWGIPFETFDTFVSRRDSWMP